MNNNQKEFTGDFYDEDYFQNGRTSKKGWLQNFHWMPKRTFRECLAFIDYGEIPDDAKILEAGTAMGFLVRAFRTLEYNIEGCDISNYALSFAPEGCWNCSTQESWNKHENQYTHVIVKDMLEHLTVSQLYTMLANFAMVAQKAMFVIPMGDNGVYRIPEYHLEISHLIAEDETWWKKQFNKCGWRVVKDTPHTPGLKDNWLTTPNGNHVFVLEKVY